MAFDKEKVTKRCWTAVFDSTPHVGREHESTRGVAIGRPFVTALMLIAYSIMTPSLAATPEAINAEASAATHPASRTVLASSANNAATSTVSWSTQGSSSPAAVDSVSESQGGPPLPGNQRILDEIRDFRAELTSEPSSWQTSIISGLLGGLLVAASSAWIARRRERFDDLKAQRELALQALEQLLAWRFKQAEQFYGPLNALLGQSKGVYEQLRNHLAIQDPKTYRRKAKAFEVRHGKKWVRFRLLDEMPIIYDTKTSAGPLIDEVMSVGDRIVSTIHSHAGLALTENAKLVPVLAQYLAHFVVLKEMYKAVKEVALPTPELRGRYTSGYFPIELGDLVKQDLMTISADLRSWELALKSLAAKSNVSTKVAANG